MLKSLLASLITAGVALHAGATARPSYDAQYIFDGQYTAALQQHAQRWRLLPLRGGEVDVAANCAAGAALPKGLWYVTPDADGRPQLEAPSVTQLPPDFPQRVALRRCGESGSQQATLFVPAQALDWIAANAGTVLIDD